MSLELLGRRTGRIIQKIKPIVCYLFRKLQSSLAKLRPKGGLPAKLWKCYLFIYFKTDTVLKNCFKQYLFCSARACRIIRQKTRKQWPVDKKSILCWTHWLANVITFISRIFHSVCLSVCLEVRGRHQPH